MSVSIDEEERMLLQLSKKDLFVHRHLLDRD